MRFLVLKRSRILFMLGILTLYISVMLISFGGPGGIISAIAPKRELPIYNVKKDEKVASLSFDAAWGNEDTDDLIAIFKKYNIKVTFFVVGDWVTKYPESVKALSDAGHEVMNHSDKHKHMPRLSSDGIINDLNSCNDKIEKITGKRPILFRPPYGDYNDSLINSVRSINMFTIQWDVDSLDWMDKSADFIADRVTKRVKNGSIVLFHNAAKNTPESLPRIIEYLQNNGYQLIPISELIYKENYKINSQGCQYIS